MTLKVDGTNGVLQAYDYQVLTTGFSYTFAAGVQLLLAVPAGTLATGTVTMPASPVDGMNITITSTQQITALTVNANTGQSIVGGATTLAAGGSQTFVYRLANTTWYSQNNNASTLPGTQGQVFTSNGTFTIPTGVTAVKVTVVGGGGGSGGAPNLTSSGGSGGGGGGAAISYLTGLTPGGTLAVTIGAGGTAGASTNGSVAGTGGTSSVASGTQTISTISATGGAGGASTSGSANSGAAGGAGGIGSGGSMNIAGGGGNVGQGESSTVNLSWPGAGGSSIFGGGGQAPGPGSNGVAGRAYGGGAGGANNNVGSGKTGGAGAAGVVVFEW